MRRLLLATSNANKVREVRALLRGEPFPWGYLALLLAMLALYRWRARGAPKQTEAST